MDRVREKSKIKSKKSKVKKIFSLSIALLFFVFCFLFLVWWRQGWNGKDPWNVVIFSESEIWVLSVRPAEHRLIEIMVPGTTVIHPQGRGQLLARALWQVSQLDHDPTVASAVGTDLLQVPIDESIHLGNWIRSGLTRIQRPSLFQIPEFIRLVWYKRSLRGKEILKVELGELPAVRHTVDPGGTELLEVDQELLSPLITSWFEILEFRGSGLSTCVVDNNNAEAGSGVRAARTLEHVGLRVVSVSHEEKTRGLYVRSVDLQKSSIVRRLSTWFHESITVSEFGDRCDILVVR